MADARVYLSKNGGFNMESFIKTFDEMPFWLKAVLALPGLDISWCLYRIMKSAKNDNAWGVVAGVIAYGFAGSVLAFFDFVYILIKKQILWFD